ncbi:MAG TPA: hypothetical protein VF476_16145, partial [Chitinophagaceae bacterium]
MKMIAVLFLLTCLACSKGGGSGDGAQPTVSIVTSVNQSEGNSGTTAFNFTVTLSKAYSKQVT